MPESGDSRRRIVPQSGGDFSTAGRTVRTRQATLQYPVAGESPAAARTVSSVETESATSIAPAAQIAERAAQVEEAQPTRTEERTGVLSPIPSLKATAASDGRTAVMPLAALLPALGELSSLQPIRPLLERRYRALQAEHTSSVDGEARERWSEESMLNHVLQWLSLGNEK